MADPKPTPDPAPLDLTACPHWGKGGRYSLDPVTGVRTPLDEDGKPIVEPSPVVDSIVLPKKGK